MDETTICNMIYNEYLVECHIGYHLKTLCIFMIILTYSSKTQSFQASILLPSGNDSEWSTSTHKGGHLSQKGYGS